MIDVRDNVVYEGSGLLDSGEGAEIKQAVLAEGFSIDLAERLARHFLSQDHQGKGAVGHQLLDE